MYRPNKSAVSAMEAVCLGGALQGGTYAPVWLPEGLIDAVTLTHRLHR
jgi:hypothetical protein